MEDAAKLCLAKEFEQYVVRAHFAKEMIHNLRAAIRISPNISQIVFYSSKRHFRFRQNNRENLDGPPTTLTKIYLTLYER